MTSLAALMNCTPQYVSAFCTADGPPSFYANFIAHLQLMFHVNPAAALKILDDAQLRFDEWSRLGRGLARPSALGDLAGSVAQETADLVTARLTEAPERRQRQEALEVIAAAQRFIRGLDESAGEQSRRAAAGGQQR
jgi:hypothetical protein